MRRQSTAIAAILFLVSAQLLAAAHFHQSRPTPEFTSGSADLVCAVCVMRTHAPAASVGTGALFAPASVSESVAPWFHAGSLAPRILRLSGRSPPA